MDRYAELFGRGRALVAGFVLVMSLLAVAGLSRLELDDVPRGIFASDDEAFARLQRLYADFGSDDNDVLLVLEADDWFTPGNAALLRGLAAELAALEGVETVTSLADAVTLDGGAVRPLFPSDAADPVAREAARERALRDPLVRGRLLSEDGHTVLLPVRLAGDALSITQVEPVLESIREVTARRAGASGVRARTTGIPAIRVEIYRTLEREQVLFFAVGAAICLGLALALFRSAGAVLVTGLPPLVGSMWALGFVGLIGEKIDILGSVLPAIVIVIGFTDAVHLMIDVRISRGAGLDPRRSAVEAIRHVGLPCALTSLTTAVGFGSLAVGNVSIIRRFGLLAALGVGLAFLAVITTMPLLASLVGRVGTSRPDVSGGPWGSRFAGLVDAVTHHHRLVAACGLAVTLGLAATATRLVPENRLTEALPRGEAYEALAHCEQAFGGVLPSYVLVEWSAPLDLDSPAVRDALEEVEALYRSLEHVSAPLSVATLLAAIPGGLEHPAAFLHLLPEAITRRLVRPDLSRALVEALVPDAGSDVMVPLYARLSAGLAEVEARHPGVELNLTGTDFVARSNVNRMIGDLSRSLGFAILVIFGVIALEFRSIVLGLASLLPNLFPLALVASLLVVMGVPLQMSSAVLFTVLLGLAVDDTIHFMARLRREAGRHVERRAAVRASFLAVGRAIVITTVVLGAGFLAVTLSAVPTSRLFGLLAVLGLLAALVGDLVLLPALLLLVGRGRSFWKHSGA